MNNVPTDILQWISNSLLIPDIVLLFGLLALTVSRLGGFAAEAFARFRGHKKFAAFVGALKRGGVEYVYLQAVPASFGLPKLAFAELQDTLFHADKTLDDLQLHAEAALKKLHIGIRVGPMLGLAGTLIPLGPALKGLAAGDLNSLANNLIVAFATPVVGIAIGGISFFMYTLRQRWYTQDLSDIEFIIKWVRQDKFSREPAVSESAPQIAEGVAEGIYDA
jgi:biopolymer transport protein ExbB/TolQ